VVHRSSLTILTVLDSTQSTENDSSCSEADLSDDNESIPATIAAPVRRKQKTSGQTPIESLSQQRVAQKWPATPQRTDSFFGSVDLAGFPPSKAKAQPWKRHWSHAQPPLRSLEGKEVIVLCSSRWDHGRRLSGSCYRPPTDTF
jgi:hypothetical protein